MDSSTLRKQVPVSALLDSKIVMPAIGSAFVKLDPRTLIKNPVMFVLEVVTALTTIILIRDLVTGGPQIGFEFQIIIWLWFTVLFANFAEAVAEGRGKAQAETLRRQRTETQAKLLTQRQRPPELSLGAQHESQGRRCRPRRSRRFDTFGRRSHRRHGLGQRSGDYRRIGAGDPRIRRRSLRGHRRHAGSLGLDTGAHHGGARLDLPRPDDPAGRRRGAAENAERNRAQHLIDRSYHYFCFRHRDHPKLRRLCRQRRLGRRPCGFVCHFDPDDDRRAVIRHRHRRHGSSRALQRAGDVRPGRRGGRRRRHPSAR